MKKVIQSLLRQKIHLNEEITEDVYIGTFDGKIVKVTMNDFPDEIMYSIFYDDERLDLDDLPKKWEINYR